MPKTEYADRIGDYVTISTVGETARAYVPKPLPPRSGKENYKTGLLYPPFGRVLNIAYLLR